MVYLGMFTGKATAPSAAEMLSTIEVRARMFPCSGESAALRRSAERPVTDLASEQGHGDQPVKSNVWAVLTLAAVALCALLWSAAPLWATAAGAARTGLAWRRHLLPWRHRSCCQSLCVMTWQTPTHRETQHTLPHSVPHTSSASFDP